MTDEQGPIPMTSKSLESERVGVCFSCRHARVVRTDRGSVFYQCQLAATDPRYAKYPRLPVIYCPGHELKEEERC
jgi:hypothetical protein